MSYILAGTTLRAPHDFEEQNTTQVAQNRTLAGNITRDYFGSNKRIWILNYQTTQKSDFDTINAIYQSYLSTATAKTWQVSETNYTVSQTNVHVDLQVRSFNIFGTDYLSDFALVLTEA